MSFSRFLGGRAEISKVYVIKVVPYLYELSDQDTSRYIIQARATDATALPTGSGIGRFAACGELSEDAEAAQTASELGGGRPGDDT